MFHKAVIPFEYLISEEAKPKIENGNIIFYINVSRKKAFSEKFLSKNLISAANILLLPLKDGIINPPRKYEPVSKRDRNPSLFDLAGDAMKLTPVYIVPQADVKESFSLDAIKDYEGRIVTIPLDKVIA